MYAHFRVAPNATSGLLGGNLVIEVTAEGTIEKAYRAFEGLQSSSYKLKRRSSLNLLAAWNPLNSPWWWERRVRYLSLAAIFLESPTTDDHGAEGCDHHDLRPQ